MSWRAGVADIFQACYSSSSDCSILHDCLSDCFACFLIFTTPNLLALSNLETEQDGLKSCVQLTADTYHPWDLHAKQQPRPIRTMIPTIVHLIPNDKQNSLHLQSLYRRIAGPKQQQCSVRWCRSSDCVVRLWFPKFSNSQNFKSPDYNSHNINYMISPELQWRRPLQNVIDDVVVRATFFPANRIWLQTCYTAYYFQNCTTPQGVRVHWKVSLSTSFWDHRCL